MAPFAVTSSPEEQAILRKLQTNQKSLICYEDGERFFAKIETAPKYRIMNSPLYATFEPLMMPQILISRISESQDGKLTLTLAEIDKVITCDAPEGK